MRPGEPPVVVINAAMARRLWPGQSAIGRRIRSTDPQDASWRRVIGVVQDVRSPGHLGAADTPLQIYQPMVDDPWGYFTVVLRAASPRSLVEAVRRAVAELDGDLPVAELRTVEAAIGDARQGPRAIERLLGGFALLGLLLAAVGLYGVTATTVGQRTRELGIRRALGAEARHTLSLVLVRAATLTLAGTLLGMAGALVLGRWLRSLLPGLPADDPLGLPIATGVLLVVALVASLVPAWRATRVDPMVAVRAE
jgi:putative ABC transport system permease protein